MEFLRGTTKEETNSSKELVMVKTRLQVGVAEDVFVKVGTFHFPADFVVVEFDADPRVPLILGRSFLKTGCDLIDVYEGELTLYVGKEVVTFNLDQTSRYSANYDAMSVNRIDLIDVACEEYSQEVLGFSGDILLLEEFLNDDPSSPTLPPQELKGDDKLSVITAKDLKDEEKTALIKVLKSHKQALAWKLSDIKGCFTVVENEENELIPTRLVMGWRVCIDYRKFNDATRKDHFPLPFMDQMLERLAGNEYYSFLDGFSGYFQIPIDPQDQKKTTFTCAYGTFAYLCMPFGLAMHRARSKEGIVLGHKISNNEIEVDKAKVVVITKLPHPTTIKGIRSFLGHVGFYRRFIQDFSKIARPMTRLLEKDTSFFFSKECIEAFQTLKKKLTEAPILVARLGPTL
nr:retrovirus-related Pol polyprotein [Tanacetum cinerariifolium]